MHVSTSYWPRWGRTNLVLLCASACREPPNQPLPLWPSKAAAGRRQCLQLRRLPFCCGFRSGALGWVIPRSSCPGRFSLVYYWIADLPVLSKSMRENKETLRTSQSNLAETRSGCQFYHNDLLDGPFPR